MPLTFVKRESFTKEHFRQRLVLRPNLLAVSHLEQYNCNNYKIEQHSTFYWTFMEATNIQYGMLNGKAFKRAL
jgi:hypothetical protein